MVHLVLSSSKGNQGHKYFPHVGYLGLTPVKVEGLVRTKLDDDAKRLQAKSLTISVRCYESRIGRVNVLHSNILVDYTHVLWSKPDGQDHAFIDELEYPFRITIPTKVGGFSNASYVDYRCVWRVEAVLNHVHIPGVGSRQIRHFELPLVRFDVPPHESSLPSPSKPLLLYQTTKTKAPRIRYAINLPKAPIGPMDIISVPIFLLPTDENVSIRTATVMIERRIVLNEAISHDTPPDTPSSPYPITSSSKSSSPRTSPSSSPASHSDIPTTLKQHSSHTNYDRLATIASNSSSNTTITPDHTCPSLSSLASDTRPLLPPSHASSPMTSPSPRHTPSKVIIDPILGAESSGHFSRDETGLWTKTVTLQWPAAKSHSRWTIGETTHSELVSIRFFARVKIYVSSPSGSEYIELSEKELIVVSTNEAQRQLAIAKYNDLVYNYQSDKLGRSKSKSPRRTHRDLEHDAPPPPSPYAPISKHSISTGSVVGSSNGLSMSGIGKVSSPRRPHTSAGPRDNKASDFSGVQARMMYRTRTRELKDSGSSAVTLQPETSPGSSRRRSGMGGFFSSSPKISTTTSGSSTGTNTSRSGSGSMTRSTSSMSSQEADLTMDQEARVREWEAVLAKVELESRKSSDKLGFSGRRERSAGVPRIGLGAAEV